MNVLKVGALVLAIGSAVGLSKMFTESAVDARCQKYKDIHELDIQTGLHQTSEKSECTAEGTILVNRCVYGINAEDSVHHSRSLPLFEKSDIPSCLTL